MTEADLNQLEWLPIDSAPESPPREWLLTDGTGSYCSTTVDGANTRRYHALMVQSQSPPVDRLALWMRLDEVVRSNGTAFELATNLWSSGATAPQGYRYLTRFALHPCPTMGFELPGLGTLVKRVVMSAGTVWVSYAWLGVTSVELELVSLVNLRSHHGETRRGAFPLVQTPGLRHVNLKLGDVDLTMSWTRGDYTPEAVWYEGYFWPEERDRGLRDVEDCLRHGRLVARLDPGQEVTVAAGTHSRSFRQALQAIEAPPVANRFRRSLITAASQFLVRRADHWTVIAGYPWFNDWGRDTMISLPGLTLTCGRAEVARSVLEAFSGHLSQGMLPNNFPEQGSEPAYNTADATLWWAWTLWSYHQNTGDLAFIESRLDELESVIEWHRKGTRYGIHVDPEDGLITLGSEQLTWMDAKVDDVVMTPRAGKPVEINALWFNFLKTLALFSRLAGRETRADQLDADAERVRQSFDQFWGDGYLHDVLRPDGTPDTSLRPNQLIALSLPFPVLDRQRGAPVLERLEAELLTPYGLRTLAPSDPSYRGRYGGGQYQRDSCYHQGTVWPWLLGPWADARRYVHGNNPENRATIRRHLEGLEHHTLYEAGLGTVSEVFDGDPPHRPGGCFAQAWSVAEPLRILTWLDEHA